MYDSTKNKDLNGRKKGDEEVPSTITIAWKEWQSGEKIQTKER